MSFLCLSSFLFSFFRMDFLNEILAVLCDLEVEEDWELVIISRLFAFNANAGPREGISYCTGTLAHEAACHRTTCIP